MTLRRPLRDAVLAFVYFTVLLTPYVLWVVHMTWDQYLAWLAMQTVLVPPLGAGFAWLLRRVDDA